MMNRNGEKIGWTAGWIGGFIWVAVLSLLFLWQGKWSQGLMGLLTFGFAVCAVLLCAPWRHPSTFYWKLVLTPYGALFLSVVWALWSFGGLKAMGLDWWSIFWFLPLLIPMGNFARKKWSDGDDRQVIAKHEKPRE